MFATRGSHRSVKMFQKIAVVVLALAVLLSALPVGKAYAWGFGEYTSSYGTISFQALPTIDVGDITQPSGTWFTLRGPGPVVNRLSGYAGTQDVYAGYYVDQYTTSGWVNIRTQAHQLRLYSNGFYAAFFPAVNIQLPAAQTRGYYRFRMIFAFRSTNGALLGAVEVLPNRVSDHLCSYSSMRLCQSYVGYFGVGEYGTMRW